MMGCVWYAGATALDHACRVWRGGAPAGRGLLLAVVACGATGCGQSQGALLYFLGLGRPAKVEAKFRLTDQPVLILVDDVSARLDWPATAQVLQDDLGQALLKHRAAKRIVPRRTLEQLRQASPDFEKQSCRQIGERAGAEQVLWIEVQSFLADELIRDASRAAYFSATVKVVNVGAQQRSEVRLWPTGPVGHLVTVTMTGSEVAMSKTKDAIAKALAARLADRIARLFYDHRLDDFGRER